MLKRKIFDSLLEWKNNENKKSLVVTGARQVGKTFAIKYFGDMNYKEVFYINFKEKPSAKSYFSGDLDVDTLLFNFKLDYIDAKFEPGKTIIILDEIQECEEAITALKFFTIDGRFDVIASGSMLGIDYKRASSYPVGYVEYLTMYGLDFEEFLWSQGIDAAIISKLQECFEQKKVVPVALHEKMTKLFRMYIVIGGMPEVVWEYVQSKDISIVDKKQKELLIGYQQDIAHYATPEEKIKAEKCFMSLTKQLLEKENHKFQYKEIEKGGRAQKYFSSIEWLLKANIVNMSCAVSDIKYDLTDYVVNTNFRVYTSDLSLLIAMRDYSIKKEIIDNTFVGNTKGGIYEAVAADIIAKAGYNMFFYKNETTKKEIDFLIQKEGKVIPIEIKSNNSKATSLNMLLKNNTSIPYAYKFVEGNVGVVDKVITMPHYMLMFL